MHNGRFSPPEISAIARRISSLPARSWPLGSNTATVSWAGTYSTPTSHDSAVAACATTLWVASSKVPTEEPSKSRTAFTTSSSSANRFAAATSLIDEPATPASSRSSRSDRCSSASLLEPKTANTSESIGTTTETRAKYGPTTCRRSTSCRRSTAPLPRASATRGSSSRPSSTIPAQPTPRPTPPRWANLLPPTRRNRNRSSAPAAKASSSSDGPSDEATALEIFDRRPSTP